MKLYKVGHRAAFISMIKFRVDHKMGHYTGEKIISISDIWNNSAYFSRPEPNRKVADVMIKPSNLKNLRQE